MKTINKSIETKDGKIKVQYQIEYTNYRAFYKENSSYDGYSIQDVHLVYEGEHFFMIRKSFWNEKRTRLIEQYIFSDNVLLLNEKQVLEYIYRTKK